MKSLCTLFAVVAILMAGFMSVCSADENCTPEAIHAAAEGHTSHASSEKSHSQQAKKDHCGTLCHIAPYIFPAIISTNSITGHNQDRIASTNDTIRANRYTVIDQPPRA